MAHITTLVKSNFYKLVQLQMASIRANNIFLKQKYIGWWNHLHFSIHFDFCCLQPCLVIKESSTITSSLRRPFLWGALIITTIIELDSWSNILWEQVLKLLLARKNTYIINCQIQPWKDSYHQYMNPKIATLVIRSKQISSQT